MQKTWLIVLLFLGIFSSTLGQISPPYFIDFDAPSDTLGWSHYAISGADDWQMGDPLGVVLNEPYSEPNTWCTNLTGDASESSSRVLQTPTFDLTDSEGSFLSFYHQIDATIEDEFVIEYSLDNGEYWSILTTTDGLATNWQTEEGFLPSSFDIVKRSVVSLSDLNGESNVIFRFKATTTNDPHEGWLIDEFQIVDILLNISADEFSSIEICQSASETTLSGGVYFFHLEDWIASFNTVCYFSSDTVLSEEDVLLASFPTTVDSYYNEFEETLTFENTFNYGANYLLILLDSDSGYWEYDEIDNFTYTPLFVDSIFSAPYSTNFEEDIHSWESTKEFDSCPYLYWQLGQGITHRIRDSHSGSNSWHTSNYIIYDENLCCSDCLVMSIESPTFDLSETENTVVGYWYKRNFGNASFQINPTACYDGPWNSVTTLPQTEDEWNYMRHPISEENGIHGVKFRIRMINEGAFSVDDFYVGEELPDLSVEGPQRRRVDENSDQLDLEYQIFNAGLDCPPSLTTFYFSTDSIFDGGDTDLGTVEELSVNEQSGDWRSFNFTVTEEVDTFYIVIHLDVENTIPEMREGNNESIIEFIRTPSFDFPYFNDFELDAHGWKSAARFNGNTWSWREADGVLLDTAFSGTRALISNETGSLDPWSAMEMYSPIMDLSTATLPILEFDMLYQGNNSGHPRCDLNMSYSTDNGITWSLLMPETPSYNRWYTENAWYGVSNLFAGSNEPIFPGIFNSNTANVDRNTRYNIDISFLGNPERIQFRFNLGTDAGVNDDTPEGALIDNFRIAEGIPDICIPEVRSFMQSSISPVLKYHVLVKNKGNYICDSTFMNLYLSVDSIFDDSDSLIAAIALDKIRPDMKDYVNRQIPIPGVLGDFNYLIHHLNPENLLGNEDATNNVLAWPLANDSINSYPYFNDFNDPRIDGWYHYYLGSINFPTDSSEQELRRLRTLVAPGETTYILDFRSGEWFTNQTALLNHTPEYQLLSPNFDFSSADSISMYFDLMCIGQANGNDSGGGIMEYSTNGGQDWFYLSGDFGESYNWYGNGELENFDWLQGWATWPYDQHIAVLDSTWFDASFLKGNEHTQFRFVYRNKWRPYGANGVHGFRMDNFRIEAFNVDYAIETLVDTLLILEESNQLEYNYTVKSLGETYGETTTTIFYWSLDSLFDETDSILYSTPLGIIAPGDSITLGINLEFPMTYEGGAFYLFTKIDGNNELAELSELNNLSRITVVVPPSANLISLGGNDVFGDVDNPDFDLDIEYSISNTGSLTSDQSATGLYWSEVEEFTQDASLISLLPQAPINGFDSISVNTNIIYPVPVYIDTQYYIYVVADDLDSTFETSEEDNIGQILVHFEEIVSQNEQSWQPFDCSLVRDQLLISLPHDLSNAILNIWDNGGKLVFTTTRGFKSGRNTLPLSQNLSAGNYLITIYSKANLLRQKFHVPE